MRILLVEDDGSRQFWFRTQNIGRVLDIAQNVEEAKRLIDEHTYDQIFLDHDLADEHYAVWRESPGQHDATTGYAVAKYLAEKTDRSPNAEIIIHSLNPWGSERMLQKLRETRTRVQKVDFLSLVRSNK